MGTPGMSPGNCALKYSSTYPHTPWTERAGGI